MWPIVYGTGPTLAQHWIHVSCLLGETTFQAVSAHITSVAGKWYSPSVMRLTQIPCMRLVEMTFSPMLCLRSWSTVHWINVTCLLVCCTYCKIQRCDDLDILCVIGQGRVSHPMICLRSRSAALRMFFHHNCGCGVGCY